jgi:hypothetical protein
MSKGYVNITDSFQDWLDDNDINFEDIVMDLGVECYRKQEGNWHYFAYEVETPEFCLVTKHEEKEYDNGDRSGSVDYIYKGSIKAAKKWLLATMAAEV